MRKILLSLILIMMSCVSLGGNYVNATPSILYNRTTNEPAALQYKNADGMTKILPLPAGTAIMEDNKNGVTTVVTPNGVSITSTDGSEPIGMDANGVTVPLADLPAAMIAEDPATDPEDPATDPEDPATDPEDPATDTPSDQSPAETARLNRQGDKNGVTTVVVTEKVPGAGCVCKASCNPTDPIEKRKYECTITPGLAGFQQMLATIIKWFINIVMLCAVLAIVGLGIAWSFAGGDDAKAKTSLKKWGVNIMVGLIILFFFRYILQFLAPWIYK